MKGEGIAVVGRERRSGGVGDGLRCTVALDSANATPGKVVSETVR